MLVHGEQADRRCTSRSRPRARSTRHERDHRHLRQGQGRGGRHRVDVGRRRTGEPLFTHAHVGVHPRRGRLGRRPWPRRRRATCRPTAHPITRSPTRRRPTRRSSTGCRATATRCTPTRRSRPWAASTRPILHGLCTYGFTGRALLHTLCGGDPARFTTMEGRFSSPVFPGEASPSTCGSTVTGTRSSRPSGAATATRSTSSSSIKARAASADGGQNNLRSSGRSPLSTS